MPQQATPGPAEMEVLEALSRVGPATVQKVREALPKKRKLAHSTIITVLYRLEVKGLVKHKKSERGKAFTFFLARPIPAIRKQLVLRFLREYFDNDPISLFSSLLDARPLSTEQLDRLREMLNSVKTEKAD